jgi:excisionase family DNA binding protein
VSTHSKRRRLPDAEPYLIGYDELAVRTNISRRTWERRVCEGKVPGVVKVGHAVRFNWSVVTAWLDRGGNG